jgi:hypothetical protein
MSMTRASWGYDSLMPTVPWIGTGLSPLAQWNVVPSLAFRFAQRGSSLSPPILNSNKEL